MTKVRHTIKQLSTLKNGDAVLNSYAEIEQHILDFYTGLYASNNSCINNGITDRVVPSLVSSEDNAMLTAIPTAEEVKSAFFSMNGLGAPGLVLGVVSTKPIGI